MNPLFILVVCFAGLWLALVIATAISKTLTIFPGLMGRMRRFQSDTENSGWRIQMIAYDDLSKPLTVPTRGLLGIVPILGAFGFLIGIGLVTYDRSQFAGKGVPIAVLSLLIAIVCAAINQRWGDQQGWDGWDVGQGRCVDRELRKVWVVMHGGGRWEWVWRIVCEYEYLGIPYRVTPKISPNTFGSEEAARAFLDQRISNANGCTLRVNPKNPLQTTLIE